MREIVNTNSNISQLKCNDEIIDDPKLISQTFVNYFTNVGPNLDEDSTKHKSLKQFNKQK